MNSNIKTSLIAIGQFILILVSLFVVLVLFALLHGVSPVLSGIFLIVGGICIVIFGDKKSKLDEGKVGRLFSHSPTNQTILKWVLGLVLIWAGVCFILKLNF